MKRMIAFFLCFCLLAGMTACASSEADDWRKLPALQEARSQAEPGPEIAPRQVGIQVGAYREMELLPGVPGQNFAALYVRSDGTLDYLFCEDVRDGTEEPGHFSFRELGFQYYTVSPDGIARKQPDEWMDQLDAMFAAADEVQGCWPFAVEGKLVFRCFTNSSKEQALYLLEDGVLSQIPSVVQLSEDGGKLDLLSDDVSIGFDKEQLYAVTLGNPTIYTCSYTGKLLASTPMQIENRETLPAVIACGSGILWVYGDNGRCIQIDLATGTELRAFEAYNFFAPGKLYISEAFSPDGQSFYRFTQTRGNQRATLTRNTSGGSEDLSAELSKTSLLNRFRIDEQLAVSNDGRLYAFVDGSLRQYVYDPAAAVEPEHTLQVWSLHDSLAVRSTVQRWNETHPDIFCDYTVATDDSDRDEAELIAELTSKLKRHEGPDVVVLDGMPVDELMEQGLLASLNELDVSDVYPNLLARYTKEGTLYAVPGRFIPWLTGAAEGSEPVRSLEGFADLVESYSKPQHIRWNEPSEDANYAFFAEFADIVFDQWYPAWSEAIWADGSFHEDRFESFVTQTGRLVRHYDLQTADTVVAEENVEDDHYRTENLQRRSKAVHAANGSGWEIPYVLSPTSYEGGEFEFFDSASNLARKVPARAYTVMPTPGPDGIGAATVSSVLALRRGGQTELGREFMQCMLSLECQTVMPNGWKDFEGWAVTHAGTTAKLQGLSFSKSPEEQGSMLNDLQEVLCELRVADIDQACYEAAKNAALRYYEGKLSLSEAIAQAGS